MGWASERCCEWEIPCQTPWGRERRGNALPAPGWGASPITPPKAELELFLNNSG